MLKPTRSRSCFLLIGMLILHIPFIARLNAQIVIGGDTIDQSAVLDIQDRTKGILLSRLSTEQRNAIEQPAFGLLILNTTTKCLEINTGSPNLPKWKCLTMGIPEISEADTLYWSTKLGAKDTIALSNRIDRIVGLPTTGNTPGDILFWNGSAWVRSTPGQNGQVLQLIDGVPTWAGAAFARLTTDTANSITTSSATLGGHIISDGGAVVTARGLVYSTAPNPTISHTRINMGSDTGRFSTVIQKLNPNTMYYVRAFATNSAGTTYGNEVRFTTLGTVPTVSTNPITNITENAADGGGEISSDGGADITARGLVYGTSPSPTLSSSVLSIGSGTGSFSGTISGLSANTIYYVRAFATNIYGTTYGNEQVFVIQDKNSSSLLGDVSYVNNSSIPIDTQQWQYIAITKDNNNQAKVYKNGKLAFEGNYNTLSYSWYRLDLGASYYTSYSQWFNGYIDDIRISNKVRTTSEIQNYFNSNTSLSNDGNTIGLWRFDQTSGTSIPAVVGTSGTTINASWDAQGRFGQCLRFNGTNARAQINQSIPTSNMTFEFWIKPSISQQSWPISWYGLYTSGFMIRPQIRVPGITTTSISTITSNTAVGGGNVTTDGGAEVTSRGLVYSTSPTPTLSNAVLNVGSGTGSFSSTITGLTPNTTYYVRAFATNSAGTVYGTEVQFTTEANILENKVIDIDGNIYNTIQIGSQIWMQENLRVSRYQNGDQIPAVKNIDTWSSASAGLRGWYNNDSTAYNAIYGALYNWYAAVDVRGVCPTGWHVPSDAEWTTLSNYLGGATIAGGKMKSTGTTVWNSPNEGATNESGFSALPAGNPYEVVGNAAYFWSSTDYNGFAAWNRVLVKDHGGLVRQPNDHVYAAWYQIGVSIRCLKD